MRYSHELPDRSNIFNKDQELDTVDHNLINTLEENHLYMLFYSKNMYEKYRDEKYNGIGAKELGDRTNLLQVVPNTIQMIKGSSNPDDQSLNSYKRVAISIASSLKTYFPFPSPPQEAFVREFGRLKLSHLPVLHPLYDQIKQLQTVIFNENSDGKTHAEQQTENQRWYNQLMFSFVVLFKHVQKHPQDWWRFVYVWYMLKQSNEIESVANQREYIRTRVLNGIHDTFLVS
jgi:hypothetical protein